MVRAKAKAAAKAKAKKASTAKKAAKPNVAKKKQAHKPTPPAKKAAPGKPVKAAPKNAPAKAPAKKAPAKKAAAPVPASRKAAFKPAKPGASKAKATPVKAVKAAAKPSKTPAKAAKAPAKAAAPAAVVKAMFGKPVKGAPMKADVRPPAKAAAATTKKQAVAATAVPDGAKKLKAAKAPRQTAAKARRTRRGPRVTPTSAPLAAWISQEGPRPSSFLPAPPRAQSAFTVAAAPASSDRLLRAEDLQPQRPIKIVPVLIHIEQEAGRMYVRAYPPAVTVQPGAALEWDFRYFGGADVLVDQVIIELDKPSPFGKSQYKSQKPGSARPHRQLSEIASEKSLGKTTNYVIRCISAFRTDLTVGKASIEVHAAE